MKFADPPLLVLMLLVVPCLALFLWWGWRKKQHLIRLFVRSRLLAQLTVGVSPERQWWRRAMLVLATAGLFIALARPQWGYSIEEVHQRGLDILVAIDCSRSMLAEDASPNRLRRTKLAVFDLMRMAKNDRLGLIAFAGTAFLQCPLTLDDEAFRQSVEALDVAIMPQGGTALAEAIRTAIQSFKDAGDNYRALVLFSDGEDHEAGIQEAIQEAQRENVRVFTIGVGSAAGELLRLRDEKGVTHFVKDESGKDVKTALNESVLQEIAGGTGGFYVPLRGATVMDQVYEKGLAPLPKSEYAERRMRRYHERFQWPLGIAIVLLLSEVFLPERKTVRPPKGPKEMSRTASLAALALLGWLILPGIAWGSSATALREYQAGQFNAAKQEYERLLKANTNDARLRLNAGISAYQAQDYSTANRHLKEASQAPDLKLQQQAYYNLGNSLYRSGENDEPQKRPLWEQAVRSYQNALTLDKQDTNAQYNLDFVKQRIQELPPPPSNQDQKQDQSTNAPPQPQNQPESNQQDKQQDQKSQEQQQQSQPQSTSNQDEKKEQPQNQASEENQPQTQDQAQSEPSPNDQDQSQTNQAASASQSAPQMTPEQAARVLDAQKDEERPLIFTPEKPPNRDRAFKDW